jgi:ATP-dependent exoDNAse (exonuclease V) beta subunit
MKIKIAKHNGNTLTYDDEKHSYVDQDGQVYTSVTHVVESLFPKFDKVKVAKRCAHKYKTTPEELIRQWTEKGDNARVYGTKAHYYAETKAKALVSPKAKDQRLRQAQRNIDKTFQDFIQGKDVVGSEKIVFSKKHCMAGTIDLLLQDSNCIYVTDWKSNEEIKTSPVYEYGFEMFRDIPSTNFWHYAVQLNLYEFILKQENYLEDKPFQRFIFHIDGEYTPPIPIPDLQHKIEEFFKC